ncbi:putative Acetyltransferase, GNAT family [Bradyrhizobium sp. ORS 285]|uniref:GNAT family N-acetyltransferase n=1 Tax=Bradyrhizobium sp. ORS 285 TaxID=115808 RepID=UPI0002407947|nr:GNAT family N-acetyltransferase [Bradyrhizobium sp. ORS 285]CCD89038.1 putative Acetyltransferase, GNAT family [Bradyrhizobium sp. ORS 285]SMX58300.1 putative Acetyltransferase, GNAT family [Bradyrhizobium sp. ORS 285]
MIIRDATPDDAAAACAVLRASIIELCEADHRGNPEILGRWLANKTPEIVAGWADGQGRSLLVAVEEETILAVGGLAHPNEITVNYVSPQARFRGLSSAMVAVLEQRAAGLGAREIELLSTETAHRFYLARGYVDVGTPAGKFGAAASYPMRKTLLTR